MNADEDSEKDESNGEINEGEWTEPKVILHFLEHN